MKHVPLLCLSLVLFIAGCTEQRANLEPSALESVVGSPGVGEEKGSAGSVPGEEPLPDWLEFDAPENHGVDSALLGALHAAAAQAGDPEIWSVVIVRNGAIVDEYYGIDGRNGKGFDESTPFYLASCTKSFMGALIGIAIDEGLIPGVDAKLSEYFPALADGDDGKGDITLEHLLTHTSGIQWSEWNGGTMFHELRRSENWVDYVLDQPMAAAPGSVFNYNSGGSHLLSAVLEKAAGQSAFDYARERLFEPLGMDGVNWVADPQGITDGGSGIEMTARDAAKFGQLYLNGGRWQQRQVISREWVERSTAVQTAGPGGRAGQYGYQWWIRPFGEGDYETIFAMGAGGHHIFVVPELELVAVITCYNGGDSYATWPYFTDYILPACG